jgi:hypothetical protein
MEQVWKELQRRNKKIAPQLAAKGIDEMAAAVGLLEFAFNLGRLTLALHSTYPDRTASHIMSMAPDTFASWLNVHRPHHAEEYQQGGAVEEAATVQPTPAQSVFGGYLESAHHLFGGDGVETVMGHFRGGAVPGSSGA